jgi:predicted outer membrane repeat protein
MLPVSDVRQRQFSDNAGSAVLTNITISGNTANNNGGGIYNTLSSPTLTNVVLSGNRANQGGGIYNVSNSSPTLTNVTIAGNYAVSQGGGIYNYDAPSQNRNSIIWGNRVGTSVNSIYNNTGTTSVAYSDVAGGYTGTGNIDGDPLFASPAPFADAPTSAGDYHLQLGSAALNAGSTAALPADDQDLDGDGDTAEAIPYDRDGNARVRAASVDIGAYEKRLIPCKNR